MASCRAVQELTELLNLAEVVVYVAMIVIWTEKPFTRFVVNVLLIPPSPNHHTMVRVLIKVSCCEVKVA